METDQKNLLDRRIHYDIHGRLYKFKVAKPGSKPLSELRHFSRFSAFHRFEGESTLQPTVANASRWADAAMVA